MSFVRREQMTANANLQLDFDYFVFAQNCNRRI